MILTSPVWFWLLTAIAIPVAVHLWNRKSGRPHLLGTFRFLPEESFAKASRIELHELPLLCLRILLIIVLTLLLVQLFWLSDKEGAETVNISESTLPGKHVHFVGNEPELQISSETIEKIGWWNLIKQAEYDFRPESIVITGSFEQNRFLGARPEIFAGLRWDREAAEEDRAEAVWQTEEDFYAAYFHDRTPGGVQSDIREVADLQIHSGNNAIILGDTLNIFSPIRLTINSEIDEQTKAGLEYTADTWNIFTEQELLDDSLLAVLTVDKQSFDFIHQKDLNGSTVLIPANPVTGLSFKMDQVNNANEFSNVILEGTNQIPVLWIESDKNLWLNGEIPSDLKAWFFASASHQWIKNVLGINNHFLPEMSEAQQTAFQRSDLYSAGSMKKTSTRLILILLLIFIWAAERAIAPKRGM